MKWVRKWVAVLRSSNCDLVGTEMEVGLRMDLCNQWVFLFKEGDGIS